MLKGKCLCEKIEFEVQEVSGMVFNCHCSRCKKSHGSAYSTQALADKSSLKFIKGEEHLSKFNTNGMIRSFCDNCGSRLMNYSEIDNYLSVAVSAVEARPEIRPAGECFVNEKQDFVELNPAIQHFEGLPVSI